MAFLKFSRDRRGYEHFYLVQPSDRGKARPRVLYWFRTPPNIKVGRSPFAPEIRRALEAQNPDVAFDWESIVHTPIPPPMEPERWRERRRVERALRAAETEEARPIADAIETSSPAETPMQVVQPIGEATHESLAAEAGEASETAEPVATSKLTSSATAEGGMPRQGRRRRRRRGRRKPEQAQVAAFHPSASSGCPEPVEGQIQDSQAESSQSQEPAVQDSGESEDEEP